MKKIMKETIIKELQDISVQLGKVPTRIEYLELTKIGITRKTILKYFDSYTDALAQSGLSKHYCVNCDNCNKELIRTKSTLSKHNFCSQSCSATFTNKLKPKRIKQIKKCKYCEEILQRSDYTYCSIRCQKDFEYNQYIQDWKSGEECGWSGKTKQLSKYIVKYMLNKTECSCEECGWNKQHPIDNRPLVEIDHIDGDAANCNEDNLRVLCPNCHSMTPTFRARNKKSSRQRN